MSSVQADLTVLDYLYPVETVPSWQQVSLHINNREFNQALALAAGLNKEPDGEESIGGELHSNLGMLYIANGDYATGLSELQAGIGLLERKGEFSVGMMNALVAAAMACVRLKQFESAEQYLRRAQHVVHRQGGVFSVDQLPILGRLVSLSQGAGNHDAADRQQLLRLEILEKAFGADSVKLLPALTELGQYFVNRSNMIPANAPPVFKLQRVRLFEHSIALFERAVDIVSHQYGEEDLLLVPILVEMAKAQSTRVSGRSDAERMLRQAVALTDSSPTSTAIQKAQVRMTLADFYQINRLDGAMGYYTEAWHLLAAESGGEDAANAAFEMPVSLNLNMNGAYRIDEKQSRAEPGEKLVVEVQYTVDMDGRMRDQKILSSNIARKVSRGLQRQLRGVVFRPRIQDGEPVAVEGLSYEQRYVVRSPQNTFRLRTGTVSSPGIDHQPRRAIQQRRFGS